MARADGGERRSPQWRGALEQIDAVRVKHRSDSTAAALLLGGLSVSATAPRWTVLGASRGRGILGEGVRQALLRDPTYRPALEAARAMLA